MAAREVAAGGEGSLRRREQKKVDKQFGEALEQEVKAEGHELPASLKPRPKRPSFDAQLQDWRDAGRSGGAGTERVDRTGESRVMRDAHEVMAGRKRQLGRDRAAIDQDRDGGQDRGGGRRGASARAAPLAPHAAGDRRAGRGCRRAGGDVPVADADDVGRRGRLRHRLGGTPETIEATDAPSALAKKEIPPEYLSDYEQAGQKYHLDWAILAGIGKVECDHGRDPDPSCTQEGAVNSAGAGGPMQFLASTWATYGVAPGGGTPDRWNPADAIFGAANYLKASGAPGDYRKAIFAYNHAEWYVDEVESWAAKYRGSAHLANDRCSRSQPIAGGGGGGSAG